MPLLLLFIIIPVIEIFLFIEIGDEIGAGWTIASVLATAFIGTALVRKQGLAAWTKAQQDLNQSQIPLEELFTGLCLLVAGALLLTPGFLTDAIGFILLIPPFRKSLGATILGWVQKNGSLHMHRSHMHGFQNRSSGRGFRPGQEDIIDGDYEVVDPDTSSTSDPDKNKKIGS